MLGVFRRAVATLFFATILLGNAVSHAEVKTYVGEGHYVWVIYKDDYLETARERAKAFAMRNACEKAIVDVKSHMGLENLAIDEDVIETMTKDIVKLVEEPHFSQPEYKIYNDWDFLIRVTVKVQLDDSEIISWLNKDPKRIAFLVAQTKAMRKEDEKQDQQIAELREELARNPNKKKLAQKFEALGKTFLSNQKVEKAWQCYGLCKYRDDYARAINLHNEALSLNPNNALAYYGRGVVYMEGLKQYEQAIQDFNKALELKPDLDVVYNDRCIAYLNSGEYEKALQDGDKAVEVDPNDAAAYLNRGDAYYDLEQDELAIQDYDKAIELNPDNAVAYTNRGCAYAQLGQYELAIQDYDKALELNPNDADTYLNRGDIYYDLGEKELAIQDYESAIIRDTYSIHAHLLHNNHSIAYPKEQYEQAIQDYDKVIERDPNFSMAYNNRGNAYYYLGQYKRAIQDFDKAIELEPKFPVAYTNRGNAYYKLGQKKRAIQDYDKSIEFGFSSHYDYNNRGIAYLDLGQYERAIQDFDEAIECESDFAEAYGNRGAAHYYLKNYEQALADLNKSIELGLLGKDLGKVLYYRGRCYQKLGDKGKAQADFAKAKELGYKG